MEEVKVTTPTPADETPVEATEEIVAEEAAISEEVPAAEAASEEVKAA